MTSRGCEWSEGRKEKSLSGGLMPPGTKPVPFRQENDKSRPFLGRGVARGSPPVPGCKEESLLLSQDV
ncbi:hypothetical protein KM043_013312 [Ampulex compressa]|nr:hypothetical protein KM043_013312 [Ampulex compressa]